MQNVLRLLAGCLAFGLMLSGCGGGQRAPAPARTASRPAPLPVRPAIAPADYVSSASALDLYVIKASELALQRSQALRVREVAQRLIAAHRGSSAQLSLSGRRLNLLPSSTVGPRLQALLEQLDASASFDRDYAAQMKRAEQEAVALHRSYAAGGGSPTLVPVARAIAPIMEQQQRLVSYL
jgi:putative membrane protein